MKKYFYYFIILILIIYIIFHFVQNHVMYNANSVDFSKMSYITDSTQIQDVFGGVNIINCWWKQTKIGRDSIGSTQYAISGFIQIDETQIEFFKNKFIFKKSKPTFKNGISPSVTNISEFDWYESDAFFKYILSKSYAGQIHLDTENGIIYFELQKI